MKEVLKELLIVVLIVAVIYGLLCLTNLISNIIPMWLLVSIIITVGVIGIIYLIKEGEF